MKIFAVFKALAFNRLTLFIIPLTLILGSLFFLLLTPNVTKPAAAAVACNTSVASVQAGNNISVTYSGFAAGESVRLFGTAAQTVLGTTNDSTVAQQTTSYLVPSNTPVGSYNIVIVTRFPITSTTCTGGPFNVTAAAAAVACNTSVASVQAGNNISVTYSGFAAGESVRLFGTAAQTVLGTTNDSTVAQQTTSYLVPSNTPVGSYNIVIVTRFPITSTTCTGGPFNVTAAGGGGGGTCSYNFSPTSIAAGGTVTITIVTAPAADTIQGGITNGTTNAKNTRTGPGTITVSAPSSGTGYVVYATDTSTGTQCALTSGTSTITITGTTNTSAQCNSSQTVPNEPALVNAMNNCIIAANNYDDKAFVKNNILGLIDGLGSSLTGYSRLNPEVNQLLAGTGALAASGRMVAMLYSTAPASGVTYFAQEIQKFNPVQPAYAQATGGGVGFDALKPVQSIWEAFRNISYVGFIIIFVVVGFMIMFRAHISPQAVATIQDSIPRIVIAIILVTFSYAIAGLMIDIMFLFLNVILNALAATHLINNTDFVFTKSVFGVIFDGWGSLVKQTYSAISHLIDQVVSLPIGLNQLVKIAGGGVAALVVGIAVLFIMFRIFFMLLMAYVSIILLTISAPFFFLFQALPGQNSASTWFKQMASNVAVFPAVALMFILVGILGGISAFGGTGSGAITSGQVGQFPLFIGGLNAATLGNIIGIGILFMTPEAANLVKQAFGTKGGPSFGGAGAAALGGAAGALGGFAGRRATQNSAVQGIQDVMEERGRQNRLRIIERMPNVWRSRPGGTTRRSEDVVRTRLPR